VGRAVWLSLSLWFQALWLTRPLQWTSSSGIQGWCRHSFDAHHCCKHTVSHAYYWSGGHPSPPDDRCPSRVDSRSIRAGCRSYRPHHRSKDKPHFGPDDESRRPQHHTSPARRHRHSCKWCCIRLCRLSPTPRHYTSAFRPTRTHPRHRTKCFAPQASPGNHLCSSPGWDTQNGRSKKPAHEPRHAKPLFDWQQAYFDRSPSFETSALV